MPELPEVEVIRRGLLPHLRHKKIVSIRHSGKRLRVEVPINRLQDHLPGATILDVQRRAKYLLLPMDSHDILIIHLGMTGNLGLFPENTPTASHDHLCFRLDNGFELRLNDTRRFGSVHLLKEKETEDLENTFFKTSGPEPFSNSCTPEYLQQRAKASTQAIKTFIMNGSILAGIGNIYANESLFNAAIHPATPANKLKIKEWRRLMEQIRKILNHAIQCGGSTISDFLNASGEKGYFQVNFKVYGREGQPCPVCSTPLTKKVINNRASYFCQSCQQLTI